jgi:hypothetical protein
MMRTCGIIGASRAMVTTARGTSYADLRRAPTLSNFFSSTTATYPAVSGQSRSMGEDSAVSAHLSLCSCLVTPLRVFACPL